MTHLKRTKESGFTLVELAIVLVIIGLIVGGVLVGQDLIKAAEIRSTVADVERYNAAANTFRNKYNGLPGDLLASRAVQFGLAEAGTPRDGTAGQGDGNSIIEGCAQSSTALGCETATFWIDLTSAQLIADAFVYGAAATTGSVANGNGFPQEDLDTVDKRSRYMPATPLRDSSYIHVYPHQGRNFFGIHAYSDITSAAGAQTFAAAGTAALSPLEASQIDDKMDDGLPASGILVAVSALTAATGHTVDAGAAAGTGVCVDAGGAGTQDDVYNVANDTFASELNCHISVRSSF